MNRLVIYFFLFISLVFYESGLAGPVTPETNGPKTQVMIIGSHFMPHDILRSNRQKEAKALVGNLAAFSPSKIVLDVPFRSAWQDQLNEDYHNYLDGRHLLNRSTREQIGFRLGEYLSVDKLYGIDTDGGFNLGELLYSARESGISREVEEFVNLDRGIETAKQHHMNTESLGRYFAYLNQPANLAYEHGTYLKGLTQIDQTDEEYGSDALSNWYEYHVKMFSNLNRIIDQPGEKVLIIVNSSYVSVLKNMIEDDPRYEWVDPAQYLNVQ